MKKKLFRGLAAALCAAMMAGSVALPAYAAGPSRESVPYADSYASYQWAFLNTGELRLVPSHTAAVDAAIEAITGSPALSADGTVRSLEGIDMNIVPAWKKYDAKSGKRQVIVALIDTGVDITHPELSGSIWTNTGEIPGDGIDNDGNGYIDDVYGWNFYDNNAQVFTGTDDNHGTHSAGTIAAARNGVGTVGICDPAYVKIMVIKTLGTSSGVGTVSNVVKAIRYAQANGASICNLSFGTMKYSEELYQAIKDSGMLFIVAAGNGDASGNGYSIDEQPMYPASFELDNIISVANLRFDGQLDRASNYGVRSVDLAAPGNYILSTITGNDYAYMSGTSMAAPMVTGTAAMLYSCDASLSLMDVRNRILQSARPLESLSGKVVTGGMLDAGAAMP